MPRSLRRQRNRRRTTARPPVRRNGMPWTPFSIDWMTAEADLWNDHVPECCEGPFCDDRHEWNIPDCVCCCHEHTFGRGCPAYAVGHCRGQGTVEERELYKWYLDGKPDPYFEETNP